MKSAVADRHYRVLCLRIVPLSGTTLYLTTHPQNLLAGSNTYLSGSGFDFTGYAATASASPGLVDIEGIAGYAGVDQDAVASGVYDNARAYLFATTWNTPVEDEEPIVASILGRTTFVDDRYMIEEMSLIDALNQSVGNSYSAGCGKTFGGQEFAGCKVALGPVTVTGTLTGVTSATVIQDNTRAEAADYFGAGTIQFTTGDNAGLKPLEIKTSAADGTLTTFEPFYFLPQVGDSYTLIPGCRKRKAEDCFTKWNNIENFGGFSFVPTASTYAQVGGAKDPGGRT